MNAKIMDYEILLRHFNTRYTLNTLGTFNNIS